MGSSLTPTRLGAPGAPGALGAPASIYARFIVARYEGEVECVMNEHKKFTTNKLVYVIPRHRADMHRISHKLEY